MQARPQGDQSNDQLGRVPKGRVQQAPDPFTQPGSQGFRGPTHEPGERDNGHGRGEEHSHRTGFQPMHDERCRHENQEQVEKIFQPEESANQQVGHLAPHAPTIAWTFFGSTRSTRRSKGPIS